MTEPLTPQREAEIREWEADLGKGTTPAGVGPYAALHDTLAELDRTRARLADHVEGLNDLAALVSQWHKRAVIAETELKRYVGAEPTIAEEMAYISRCLNAVQDVCIEAKREGALGLTVEAVEQAINGERPDNPDDHRRRLYIDGKGHGWVDQSVTSDGTRWVVTLAATGAAEKADTVRTKTGGLREIGRCW